MRNQFQNPVDSGKELSSNSGMNKRVLQYYDDIQRIKNSLNSSYLLKEFDIPYPKMAYIYPTYQCSLSCKNCMYKDHLTEYTKNESLDMDISLFRHILQDLSSLSVMNVEFCGGGEPLEHSSIDKLIELASEFRRNKRMDFGLLTNGQNISRLDESTLKIILESFAYIRLSYSERISTDKILKDEYFYNLAKLIEYKNENNKLKAIIGSKLLLTSKNKDQLLKTVFKLLELDVEHLKVKSIRSRNDEPSLEDLIWVEEELRSVKSKKPAKDVLQVDLGRTVYPEGFKCWINPLSVTIDPYGKIYMCFNFHNDPENMKIGQYNQNNSLSDFWGKSKHIEKILNINTKKVCKADNSCNCRYADYQKMMEEIFWKGLSTKYGEVNNESKSAIESKRIQKFL